MIVQKRVDCLGCFRMPLNTSFFPFRSRSRWKWSTSRWPESPKFVKEPWIGKLWLTALTQGTCFEIWKVDKFALFSTYLNLMYNAEGFQIEKPLGTSQYCGNVYIWYVIPIVDVNRWTDETLNKSGRQLNFIQHLAQSWFCLSPVISKSKLKPTRVVAAAEWKTQGRVDFS